MSTNVKIASAALGAVFLVVAVEHLCCLLAESYGHAHHNHKGMESHSMPMSHTAQLIGQLTGRTVAPCERVATIEWVLETNFNETSSAAEHVENKLPSLFPNSMLHSVKTTPAGSMITVSFELHATNAGAPDWTPLNSSLCEAPCTCLSECLGEKLGWTPLSIESLVQVDTTESVVSLPFVATGWLVGPSRKSSERAEQGLWWHLNKNGHRATVEFTEVSEVSLMQTKYKEGMESSAVRLPVEVQADIDVQALLDKQGVFSAMPWTSEKWTFEVGYSGSESSSVLP